MPPRCPRGAPLAVPEVGCCASSGRAWQHWLAWVRVRVRARARVRVRVGLRVRVRVGIRVGVGVGVGVGIRVWAGVRARITSAERRSSSVVSHPSAAPPSACQ